MFKNKIKEEIYYNEKSSLLIFKMRTNTLNLNDRKRYKQEETKCPMCDHHNEDLKHFLLHCPKLEEARLKILFLQRPRIEDKNKIIGDLLFNMWRDFEASLSELWTIRKRYLLQPTL